MFSVRGHIWVYTFIKQKRKVMMTSLHSKLPGNGEKKMKDCPVKYALEVLAGKWKMYIVYVLSENETIRFNELQRQVGDISALMLSRNLQELEKDGIVIRKEFDVIPPHVEYSLSKLGRKLTPALDTLGEWGHQVWLANGKPGDKKD